MIRHKVFYGPDEEGNWTPYLEKWGLGRLWVHRFLRGDRDEDPHDHPWAFWTFPLVAYVEDVTSFPLGEAFGPFRERQTVTAFHWHHRPATYLHRVIGPANGEEEPETGEPLTRQGTIWTLVWHGPASRPWRFLKTRDGKWCWQDWKAYVDEGGRSAPCED